MNKNYSNYLIKLKTGFLTGFPSVTDIIHEWKLRRIPFFTVDFEDQTRRELAVVSVSDAVDGLRYNDFLARVNQHEELSFYKNPSDAFAALQPAIMIWMETGNYPACSRTITAFFLLLDQEGNCTLPQLIESLSTHLENEINASPNANEKKLISDTIKRLKNLKK
jgi:hypothetical protein